MGRPVRVERNPFFGGEVGVCEVPNNFFTLALRERDLDN